MCRPIVITMLALLGMLSATVVGAQTSGAKSNAADNTADNKPADNKKEKWELVHEVDILLPQQKQVYGSVEVLLDRNSVDIKGHEVTYRARIFRKSHSSEAETLERRISDCRAGRYRIEQVTNLRSGKDIKVRDASWRTPRQAHVVKLERYICEKVCGIGYPDRNKTRAASCLAH